MFLRCGFSWLSVVLLAEFQTASPWKLGHATTRRSTLRNVIGVAVVSTVSIFPNHPVNARNLPKAASVDTQQAGTAAALEPVLELMRSLEGIVFALESADSSYPAVVDDLLQRMPSTERDFKAIFDAYSDPVSYKQKFVDQNAFLVYYSKGFDGPGRPSIESDLPVRQTLQYGARNDAWVAWDEFLAEVAFQRRNADEEDRERLTEPVAIAIASIKNYLRASSLQR